MTGIIRENPFSGRVMGVTAMHRGVSVNIRVTKGVLVATGGSRSNVALRRTFDPRLTEEYQVAGEPWSKQSGDGELAGMAIGAALWSTANQTAEDIRIISKTARIGCKWGYASLIWEPDSVMFPRARASGLTIRGWQDAIMVKQTGRRFWNEMDGGFDFYAAAMAYSGDDSKRNGGGPIWAIFDAGATVARYNSFVDTGTDLDFGKPTPMHKIQTPPFYAAWSTPILHDCTTGLRTNMKAQVMDYYGQVIPGLYCAGESQGGFAQHGLGRCLVFGRIAGRDAALNGGEA